VFLVAAVLAAMLGTAAACLITRGAVAAWLLVLCSAAWLPLNTPIEGPVILPLSNDHGVTVADLLSVAGFGIAALVLWRSHPPAGSATSMRRRAASILVAFGIALAGAAAAYQH
jgi:hypothetical protein